MIVFLACGAMVSRLARLADVSFSSNRRSLLLAMAQRPKFYTNKASAQYGTRRLRWNAYTVQEIRIGASLSGFCSVREVNKATFDPLFFSLSFCVSGPVTSPFPFRFYHECPKFPRFQHRNPKEVSLCLLSQTMISTRSSLGGWRF